MMEKYSAGLVRELKATSAAVSSVPAVLLTGSIGNLGSFMLDALLKDTSIERGYVYNRPATGSITSQDQQKDAFLDRGFELELSDSDRLVYMAGDSAPPKLGLSDKVYEECVITPDERDYILLTILLSCAVQ